MCGPADMGRLQRHRTTPGISAIVLADSSPQMVEGVGDQDVFLVGQKAHYAEADRRDKFLLDLITFQVDEGEVFQILDHQGLPLVDQDEIDGPARKQDLLAGRLEDLVGRYHDAAIWLPADLEPFLLIGTQI